MIANPTPEAEAVTLAAAVDLLTKRCVEIDGHYKRIPNASHEPRDTANAIRAVLAALPQAGEPSPALGAVAWRYRWKPTPRSVPGDWREPTHSRWSVQDQTGYEEQALYDHPAPAQPDAGGLREALYTPEQIPDDDGRSAANLTVMLRRGGLEAEVVKNLIEKLQAALTGTQQAKGEGKIWSDVRSLFVRHADPFAKATRYEEASAIADLAASEIAALISGMTET